ncbi:hypothetical protein EJ02DRAFT_200858 [Clathrospora elynae]|uniref:Alpha/beta-hydrolase n=1 Tax=Clathrospora elynae TaxID=706981 RepID=A0A6A5SP80_9PLEO|nr:hypothetical protein EJ02DRAFT_200858 [Clathrospora elynae]
MPRPPEAHYNFTIPSVHDDTALDCRVYHPGALSKPAAFGDAVQWRRKGIVMAHPYAPMGGSYDDRVVGMVVDEFVKAGWVVGTFNFRGAHGSKARTSWSGRPELDDYTSFAGFFMHYMCYLNPLSTSDAVITPGQSPSDAARMQGDACPVVILGGYSYGSLILTHLPPVPTVLQHFSAPLAGSAADEILLRARRLADQSNLECINLARDAARARRKCRNGHVPRPSVTMGGEEISPDKRRSSRDLRGSVDGGGRLEIKTRLRSLSHRGRKDSGPATPPETKSETITAPDIRYLLISPLTPPISTLAAPALVHKFWNKSRDGCHDVIGKHVSMAIYGDADNFTSAKRIRDWSEQLKAEPASRFTSVEVKRAGHFWVESDVEEELRAALRVWELKVR